MLQIFSYLSNSDKDLVKHSLGDGFLQITDVQKDELRCNSTDTSGTDALNSSGNGSLIVSFLIMKMALEYDII